MKDFITWEGERVRVLLYGPGEGQEEKQILREQGAQSQNPGWIMTRAEGRPPH